MTNFRYPLAAAYLSDRRQDTLGLESHCFLSSAFLVFGSAVALFTIALTWMHGWISMWVEGGP